MGMSETKDIIEKHILRVREYLLEFQTRLFQRGQVHDQSKLDPATELPFFEKYASKLKECVYGSDEYKQFLDELKPALDMHYKRNRHHPEHFIKYNCNGCFTNYLEIPSRCKVCGYSQFQKECDISQMNLLDLCEMFCDWIAAGEQHLDGGNIFKSIEINQERHGYTKEVKQILLNTAKLFKDYKEKQ
jgi:hypothetical protein